MQEYRGELALYSDMAPLQNACSAMIRNLADQHEPQNIDADVLIIGAGIAGLLMATRLQRSILRVVVVESGGRDQPDDTNPLNEVVQIGDIFQARSMADFVAWEGRPRVGVAQCCHSSRRIWARTQLAGMLNGAHHSMN
jgi:choline dehydrogenase-like flavoprotein